MKAVKISNGICFYIDDALPEIYANAAISVEAIPEKPNADARLDIVAGSLVWVLDKPDPVPESGTEPSVWDELDAAYTEGVNAI